MDLTTKFILSQVFAIIMYALLGLTYYIKERRKILLLSFASNAACGIQYALLAGWSGVAMCLLAMFREAVNLIDEKKNGKRDYINKFDIVFLIFLYVVCIISAIFTFEGWLSMLSVIATMIYTFSIWQKSTKIYKVCGIPIGILWVAYNIYVKSIFAVIFESIILICSITGFILETKNKKVTN